MGPKKVLEAYAYSILAKDASGRYSNPRRALRNFEDIMETAAGQETKSSFVDQMASAIVTALKGEDVAEAPVAKPEAPAKPKVDRTAKDFYNFRKEQQNVNKQLLAKLNDLAPPPPGE